MKAIPKPNRPKSLRWIIANYRIWLVVLLLLTGCPEFTSDLSTDNSSPTPVPLSEPLKIEFTDIKPFLQPIQKNLTHHEYQKISYVEFGQVKEGKYQGGKLIRGMHEVHGLIGGGFRNPYSPKEYLNAKLYFYRFVLLNKDAILLEKNSDDFFQQHKSDRFHLHPFEDQRFSLVTDNSSYIEGIEIPENGIFEIPNTRFTFTFHQEVPGKRDSTLKKIGVIPQFGPVYRMPLHQGFRIFRPDQTMLILAYRIPIEADQIRWKINKPFGDYTSLPREFFNFAGDDEDPTELPNTVKIQKNQLKIAGFTQDKFKQPIYIYKSRNDKNLRTAYGRFAKLIKLARKTYPETELDRLPRIPTYAKYVDNVPFFFWQDPFGQMVQFTNKHFLPPTVAD